jgi:hypothetical protein
MIFRSIDSVKLEEGQQGVLHQLICRVGVVLPTGDGNKHKNPGNRGKFRSFRGRGFFNAGDLANRRYRPLGHISYFAAHSLVSFLAGSPQIMAALGVVRQSAFAQLP